jgi:hypothetical protein
MIYGIHDLLQMALKDGDEHIRIPQAHRQMQRLMNGLKELQHNIGAHIDNLDRLQILSATSRRRRPQRSVKIVAG